jgi:hypothetical protein
MGVYVPLDGQILGGLAVLVKVVSCAGSYFIESFGYYIGQGFRVLSDEVQNVVIINAGVTVGNFAYCVADIRAAVSVIVQAAAVVAGV